VLKKAPLVLYRGGIYNVGSPGQRGKRKRWHKKRDLRGGGIAKNKEKKKKNIEKWTVPKAEGKTSIAPSKNQKWEITDERKIKGYCTEPFGLVATKVEGGAEKNNEQEDPCWRHKERETNTDTTWSRSD